MPIYPDDRVLIAIMNNKKNWQRVLHEGWYRYFAEEQLTLWAGSFSPSFLETSGFLQNSKIHLKITRDGSVETPFY